MSDAKSEAPAPSRTSELGPLGWTLAIVVFGSGFLLRLWAAVIAFHAAPVVFTSESWAQPLVKVLSIAAAVVAFMAPVLAEIVLFALHWLAFPGLLPQPFIIAAIAWCGGFAVFLAYCKFLWGR
jgi:hypothetical protein